MQLPSLALDTDTHDTYKGLFMNDLLTLEVSAKRCLVPSTYERHADGSINLSVPDTVLDVSSFYLFAHKALVSALFILHTALPRTASQGLPYNSFNRFMSALNRESSDFLRELHQQQGSNLSWVHKSIVTKRDDLVQHWQGNVSKKFFVSIFGWDLPYLVYYNPKDIDQIDDAAVESVYQQVKSATSAQLGEASADSLQKIAWMEAWQPTLATDLQRKVESLLDNNLFITLPVTPQLIDKLDEVIAGIINKAVS